MKAYATMLCAAIAATLALTAIVGATSAAGSAKACSTVGTGPACGSGHGNEYTTQKVKAVTTGTRGTTLASGFNVVTCQSQGEGEITHEGKGILTSTQTSHCINDSLFGASCTATLNASPSNPYHAVGIAEGGGDGRVEVTSEITGQFTCVGITCRYRAANAGTKGEIKVTGGETATITITKVPLLLEEPSSEACSVTATWSSIYTVVTPDSIWIT